MDQGHRWQWHGRILDLGWNRAGTDPRTSNRMQGKSGGAVCDGGSHCALPYKPQAPGSNPKPPVTWPTT